VRLPVLAKAGLCWPSFIALAGGRLSPPWCQEAWNVRAARHVRSHIHSMIVFAAGIAQGNVPYLVKRFTLS